MNTVKIELRFDDDVLADVLGWDKREPIMPPPQHFEELAEMEAEADAPKIVPSSFAPRKRKTHATRLALRPYVEPLPASFTREIDEQTLFLTLKRIRDDWLLSYADFVDRAVAVWWKFNGHAGGALPPWVDAAYKESFARFICELK